jgi:hypothetical protein
MAESPKALRADPFVGEIEILHEALDDAAPRAAEAKQQLGRELLEISGTRERVTVEAPAFLSEGTATISISVTDWSDGTLRVINPAQRTVMVYHQRKKEAPRSQPFVPSGQFEEIAGVKCQWGKAHLEQRTADVCATEGYGGRSLMAQYFGLDAALNWPTALLLLEARLKEGYLYRRRVVRITPKAVPPERFSTPADYTVRVYESPAPPTPAASPRASVNSPP